MRPTFKSSKELLQTMYLRINTCLKLVQRVEVGFVETEL